MCSLAAHVILINYQLLSECFCSCVQGRCHLEKGFNRWAASWQNKQCGCAPSKDSDQPGHPPSLIRVFAVRMKKAWGLSYPLSPQQRFWSDWADAQAYLSLRWAHTHFVGFVTRQFISTLHVTESYISILLRRHSGITILSQLLLMSKPLRCPSHTNADKQQLEGQERTSITNLIQQNDCWGFQ